MAQSAPNARANARSAATAHSVAGWTMVAKSALRSARPLEYSTAIAPCPGAGTQNVGLKRCVTRCWRPSRSSPAAASTRASQAPASSLAKRVPTLPRTGANLRSGRARRRKVARRRLDVPMRVPSGRASKPAPPLGATKASRASARGPAVAATSPAGSCPGRSFMLCAAKSARPSMSAASNAFTKTPLPPGAGGAASGRSSPSAATCKSVAGAPAAASMARTRSACTSASGLLRVAMTSCGIEHWRRKCQYMRVLAGPVP